MSVLMLGTFVFKSPFPICSDAVIFDYNSLGLTQPAFFIGGLPQMGGDVLASKIISNLDNSLKEKSCMVLTGSYSEKYSFNDTRDGGWKKLIDESGLEIIKSNSLPTAWSFNQTTETPYIFTKFSKYKNTVMPGVGFEPTTSRL